MSLSLGQLDIGSIPSDNPKEHMTLSEVLGGTSFVSASGRTYRLFGNEDKSFSMPTIPAIPPLLAAAKTSHVSLEEALQQIESFALPAASKKEQPVANPPTLQIFPALGESAPRRLIKKKNANLNVSLSAKDIVDEVSPLLPKRKEGTCQPLRVVCESARPKPVRPEPVRPEPIPVEEPFIVPFAKPEPSPEEKPEAKNVVLKIVSDFVPTTHFAKTLRKCWQHRRKTKTPYRKPCSLPPPVVEINVPDIEPVTFQWSEQLNSLMQTANNQIRMLSDHLVVQSNQGTKAICFKSIFPGDGCSTILLCAAQTLTERNYRILLVDAHHRHIDFPKQLNLSSESGTDVITLNDRLGLWVWQDSKTTEENRSALAEVMTLHREEYDLILLDDGSVTESPLKEFVEFWNRVELDGVILVSNTKRASEIPVSHIAGRFREHHIRLIGITENYV